MCSVCLVKFLLAHADEDVSLAFVHNGTHMHKD